MVINTYSSPSSNALGAEGEQRVLAIFRECLDNTGIGLDDSFLDSGGDSLIAAMVLARCERAFGIRLQPAALFTHPTPRAIAATAAAEYHKSATRGGAEQLSVGLVPLTAGGTGPPLFLIHGETGSPWIYRDLVPALRTTRPVYGVRAPDLDWSLDVLDIGGLVTHHIAEVRGVQPEGPYSIAGAGIGGSIALDVACRLASDGQEVRNLILLDSPPPAGLADRWQSRFAYTVFAGLRAMLARGIGGAQLLQALGFRSLNERLLVMFGDGALTSSELLAVASVELQGAVDLGYLRDLEADELRAKLDRALALQYPFSGAHDTASNDRLSVIREWKLRAKNTWYCKRHRQVTRFPGTAVLYCGTNDDLPRRWKPYVDSLDVRRVRVGVNALGEQAREREVLAPLTVSSYAADMAALLRTPQHRHAVEARS